ncbi:hypothetical protein NQU59_14210 [Acinetobacter colistiniresistens]|uniref:hypothetical protein n=1 Tax=Acinetobacter colistiniresistens TaxID=280145 RepID=UPI00211C9F4C|nr:hypothetical protein [Acinetobacter colistiniresistens]UUM26823.1 hypothetical protein NQU59_14210 [Acinetobacter colistiniresistens]
MSRLSKSKIKHNLKELKVLYDKSAQNTSVNTNLHMIFYSKLALIEYCGWLEVSIDILIRRIMKNINDPDLVKIGEDSIKRNYGFTYDNHFRVLLIKSLGLEKQKVY